MQVSHSNTTIKNNSHYSNYNSQFKVHDHLDGPKELPNDTVSGYEGRHSNSITAFETICNKCQDHKGSHSDPCEPLTEGEIVTD